MANFRSLGGRIGSPIVPILLWENPSPTTEYTGGTPLSGTDIANYDWVIIEFKYSRSDNNIRYIIKEINKQSTSTTGWYSSGQVLGFAGSNSADGYANTYVRSVSVNAGGISFSPAKYFPDNTVNNGGMIPLKVWGVVGDFLV